MKQSGIITTIFCIFFFQFVNAQTPVQGGIYTNTTWTLANSPYLMTGSVVVFPGVTLTIEPGVEIRVKENGLAGGQYYLETRGTLNMVGQPGALITFRADTAATTLGAWSGIFVKNSQGGSVNYDYVSISNAIYAVQYDAWIPDFIELHQSEFKYNTYALTVGLELEAEGCAFIHNQTAIYGWSIFTLRNCSFDSNGAALSVYPSSLDIENSLFTNNALGLFLNSGAINGIHIVNTVFDNNLMAVYNANGGLIDSCTFVNNDEAIKGSSMLEVRNSFFYENMTALELGFGTTVMDCEINYNETGIALGPVSFGQPMPVIENNRICFNSDYNIDNRTDLNMFIPTNCFCITDSAEIEAKIFDGYDDITKGLISYAIFDTTCTSVIAYVNKSPFTGLNEEASTGEIPVFPNPFRDEVVISNPGDYSMFDIYTLFGSRILSGTLVQGENKIDGSSLSSGMYILKMFSRKGGGSHVRLIRE